MFGLQTCRLRSEAFLNATAYQAKCQLLEGTAHTCSSFRPSTVVAAATSTQAIRANVARGAFMVMEERCQAD